MLKRGIRLGLIVAMAGCLFIGALSSNVNALTVPTQPRDIPIVDQTGTLSDDQKTALAKQIADERARSGNQIAILIVPSLEDDALESFSLKVARDWGIGTNENNNGVLLLVAKNDRKLRIEVGTGLEGALTDVRTGQIIRNDITPRFKSGQYYEGLRAGLTGIISSIKGEYTVNNVAAQVTSIPWELILAFGAIIFSWLGSILARTKSWWAGGAIGGVAGGAIGLLATSLLIGLISAAILVIVGLVFDKLVSVNYRSHAGRGEKPSWWAGGGFLGGGDSGGFGGFGGGGFGGGGSSGSW